MSVPRPAMLVATVMRGLSGLGDDVGLLAILARVEHGVGDAAFRQQGAEQFGGLHERVRPAPRGRRD